MTRRELMIAAAGAGLMHARGGFKIGVTDWNLRMTGDPAAVAFARKLGFEGVEVSIGRKAEGGKLPLANEDLQKQYLEAAGREKIALAGTCLDVLHVNYLKNDKLGVKWVADGIPITKRLNAKVMLLPFFGKGALQTTQEMDYVGDALREVAPAAEKAGVILALEDTISAEDNVRIMERSRSKAVSVYYDVGNSAGAGFDVIKEIEWLGKKRIAQVHFKDNPHYLGEGKIDFPRVLKTLRQLGFDGFANLETNSPSKVVEADMKRNLTYIRKLMSA